MGVRARIFVIALAALLALLEPLRAHAAPETRPVMIVFDGSGSMWGPFAQEKQTKLAAAREAVGAALARLPAATPVGLASFGHRRRADCSDAEVMLPPQPDSRERITGLLDKLNPKGRGPVTLALRQAAGALSVPDASILLIHDDADNCQQDACAAAQELRAAMPKLTVHVIGLGIAAQDVPRTACVAEATGGKSFNVETVAQLTDAVGAALQLASQSPAAAAPAPPPPADTGPPALWLTARLADKGPVETQPVRWTVWREGAPDAPLFSAFAVNPMLPLAGGRYVAEARDGAVTVRRTIDVAAQGPTRAELLLDAGILEVRPQKAATAVADTTVTVLATGRDAGKVVTVLAGDAPRVALPPGTYTVRAAQGGLVRAERTAAVAAGSRTVADFSLTGASLELGIGGDGAASADVVFSIEEDDPDAPGGRREIARSAAVPAHFTLPAGTYYIHARQGYAEARERIALRTGERAQRALALPAARLTLASRIAGTPAAAALPVSSRIERLDAPAPAIDLPAGEMDVILPPGRYRITSRIGLLNAVAATEVTLAPGTAQEAVLDHAAATLALRLALPGDLFAQSDVFWDIVDDAGRTVWVTGQAEPRAVLRAGRYSIGARMRDRRFEAAVELRPGETRQVTLTAN